MNFDFLRQPYAANALPALLRHLFGEAWQASLAPLPLAHDSERVRSLAQLGAVRLPDTARTALNVYEAHLQPGTTKIQLNRAALARIADKIRSDAAVAGALAVFVDEAAGKWRFTFIAKRDTYDADGNTLSLATEPRRFTYLFGKGENTRTAEQRFSMLADQTSPSLDHLVEAFSVEKISREFFDQYKKHYAALCQQLYAQPEATAVFQADDPKAAQKLMRDFAKRLMGRLVFLHFLQKKGWLGVPIPHSALPIPHSAAWQGGDPDFTANLFRKTPDPARFHSRELTRLFFNTLNERRTGDFFEMPDGSQLRVPYLNGGLFDNDFVAANALDLPPEWFAAVFEFFSQYNFTIDENAPDDHAVGIDPEMLGHIFENLLEENREKGAYYTPKEIVHFMCQESLLEYLKGRIASVGVTQSHPDTTTHDLETFVRQKTCGPPKSFIHQNKARLEAALRSVRICDPAIGSGAFPMGLLHEIVQCQLALDPSLDPGALKKDIIHHCIYGVDKDKGAVDIARLRFWLSLVVDEDAPQELPNLDYKIMQGDSLLESFEGIPLGHIARTQQAIQVRLVDGQLDIFTAQPRDGQTAMTFSELVEIESPDAADLAALLDEYFAPEEKAKKRGKRPRPKADIHADIDRQVLRHIEYNLEVHRDGLQIRLATAQADLQKTLKTLSNPAQQEKLRTESKTAKLIANLEAQIEAADLRFERLKALETRAERPYFLWNLYFRDVLDGLPAEASAKAGGFDIVIGNPPYVQLQKLGKYTDLLQAEGYATAVRTADLYCLFYEKAVRILRPGGVLAFITSNSWLKTQYGEPLRRLFSTETEPLQLLNFEDSQLFKAAIVETNILLAKKAPYAPPLRAAAFGKNADTLTRRSLPARQSLDGGGSEGGQPLHRYLAEHGTDVSGLDHEAWSIGDARTLRLKSLVEAGSRPLKEFQIEIYRGVLTGFNEAFIISEATKNALLAADPKCAELIKPVLRGRDVQRYAANFQNLWLIFTKRGIDIDQYPAVKNHLLEQKSGLLPKPENWDGKENANEKGEWRGRKGGTYQWFEIQDNVAYFQNFEKPKIIWGELSDKPKFAYDEGKIYPEATLFLMTGEKLKFLLAVLNSKLSEWYFNEISTTSGMGTNRWKKYKIEQLPICTADAATEQRMEGLVGGILAGKKAGRDTAAEEALVDAWVMRLYGLSEEDAAYLLGSLPGTSEGEREAVLGCFRELGRGAE